ncbi:8904_t:CDS:2 [Acaulospora morrowiae]|uniref:8904_t:CDS:1 n=1 Tax=Acaulospora morrowiae TaxID=94023 RepID=A0A9N9CBR7_9GLOM|nr:8904_t:CDS:2 [Acaulospora morrowiae]
MDIPLFELLEPLTMLVEQVLGLKPLLTALMLFKRECLNITIIELYGGKKAISIKKQIGKKQQIMDACRNVKWTPAHIFSIGSTRTYADGSAKEADNSFRPEKPEVKFPNGIDKGTRPWPNLVIEVAYSETIDHVTDRARNYWLKPDRVHDVIVVKIEPVLEGQIPTRMIAWHYCISDKRTRFNFPARTTFEFGTIDENGTPLAFPQGACVINIALSCLYHDVHSSITIPSSLPHPIPIDFLFIQNAIITALTPQKR